MKSSKRKIVLLSTLICATFMMADENMSISKMFEDAKVSGELRAAYGDYTQKEIGVSDTYATALGGYLKYELSEFNGFGGGAAFSTSHDIGFATPRESFRQNNELSSSDGVYNVLSEAYLSYKNSGLSITAGRQIIDTPLADSDDIRIIKNSFEAYIATYEISNFSFMAGKLQKWQGYDATLDDGWVRAGKDGTYLSSVTYLDETIEASAWYYNITKLTNVAYFDVALKYEINSDISALAAAQYLYESEIDQSGVQADIYGFLGELSGYGFTLGGAYNIAQKKESKASFSGFGGGALFTSMDTMILDEIAEDREAKAVVGALSYEIEDLIFSYIYGRFDGDANSFGDKEKLVEQNFGVEYTIIEDKLSLSTVYVLREDKENADKTSNDWNRFMFMAIYSF